MSLRQVSRLRLRPDPPTTIVRGRSERSAARLAHQSGGLGVPSSNLGAPTNQIKDLRNYTLPSRRKNSALGRPGADGARKKEGAPRAAPDAAVRPACPTSAQSSPSCP